LNRAFCSSLSAPKNRSRGARTVSTAWITASIRVCMAPIRPTGVNATVVGQAVLMIWAALIEALARSSSALRCSAVGSTSCWMRSIGQPAMSLESSPHICRNSLASGASGAGPREIAPAPRRCV